jgi:predicted CopG family antitoxin
LELKTITIDENAHQTLLWAKKQCIKDGIEKPSLSEAIRHLKKIIEQQQTENKRLHRKLKAKAG